MKFEATGLSLPRNRAHLIEDLYRRLRRTGVSGIHTAKGTTLAPLLNMCVQRGQSFTLEYYAGSGYRVRLGEPHGTKRKLGEDPRQRR